MQSIMRNICLFFSIVFLFAACGSKENPSGSMDVPFIENALSYELSFGDDGIEDTYLLAKPSGIMVNDDGDIYITDEHHVKVYDGSGQPKEMFGGEGQGPGEFTAPMNPTIGPTGFITVMDILWEYNVYAPDHKFISKKKIKSNPFLSAHYNRNKLNFSMLTKIYSADRDARLIELFGQNMKADGIHPVFEYLLYLRLDSLIELVQYHAKNSIKNKNGGGSNTVKYQGELLWDVLPGGRIVYTETYYDKSTDSDQPEYFLTVKSYKDLSESVISVPYILQEIPKDKKKLKPHVIESINLRIPVNRDVQAILNKTDYYPPLKIIKTDRHFIFAFLFNGNEEDEDEDDMEEKQEPYYVDVIDADSGKYIAKTVFRFVPDIIKNGCAYRLVTPADAFPTVEKYRIDPAVYGQ